MTNSNLWLIGLIVATGFFGQTLGHAQDSPPRPNILWIVSEDNSTRWVGCYGNEEAETPNLDKLAAEGFRYTRCFADAPVCAAQRSTWITGMASLSLGTHPMRSHYPVPEEIPVYPAALKAAGYYTHNARKTDYNGIDVRDNWDSHKDDPTPWRRAPEGQPWFGIVNIYTSHESRAFGDVDNTKHDPANMDLAVYHPDIPKIRKNYARYADHVTRMDAEVGKTLAALETDGLAEDTIVIYNSDHGGVLPRSKRFLYDSGTHCPLIMRIPEKFAKYRPGEPGEPVEEIVSFQDLPTTMLKLAGAEIPDLMQGRVFLGADRDEPRRRHFAFRERMDERYDNARAVRDERYLYIRNYAPFAPWMQHLNYLWRMVATKAWEAEFAAGKTTDITGRWFTPKQAGEEFYDTLEDPDCVNNLVDDPAHAGRVEEMRAALREWQLEIHDTALIPEFERVHRAKQHDVTIYEMARDPRLYDLPAYLDAADIATTGDPQYLPRFLELLNSEDPGLRYWGAIGILMLENRDEAVPALADALEDDSHEVRAYAAWALIRQDEKTDEAYATLRGLLENRSYASLIVLNIVDWMGRHALPLREDLEHYAQQKDIPKYDQRIMEYLNAKVSKLGSK